MAKLGFMHPDSFDSCTIWLDSFIPKQKESTPGLLRKVRLERMRMLLDALDNPQDSFQSIHVAGSKGKGSVCRYISALLSAKGYRTGLYLSPHLFDYRERFTLDGSFFPDSLLVDTCKTLKDTVDSFSIPEDLGPGKPSTFELYTALAYMLFRAAGCQWAVVETGLGGRLDATNTLESVASVITPIELEHTQVLGDTIEKIATEKSKIIKRGQTVFAGLLRQEAFEVVRKEAERQSSRLISLTRALTGLETETRMEGECCHIGFTDGFSCDLTLSMRGEVQAQNAALALLVARNLGFYEEGKSERALEKASLPGRFEVHRYRNSTLVLDVCHTASSTAHTVSSFNALFPQRKDRCCIFSSIEGKDAESMLSTILSAFAKVIVSDTSGWKKSDPEGLFSLARRKAGKDVEVVYIPDFEKALDEATAGSSAVLVAGSFYLASRFREVIC